MPGMRRSRFHWLDLFTIGFFLVAGAILLKTGVLASRRSGPEEVASVSGRRIKVLPTPENTVPSRGVREIQVSGSVTVIYAFQTTCPACTMQYDVIGAALSKLQAEGIRIISASTEPDSLVAPYWNGRLPQPVSLAGSFTEILGIPEVPAIFVLDSSGTVRRAYKGYVRRWTPDRIVSEVLNALKE